MEEALSVGVGGGEKLEKSHLQIDVEPKLTQKQQDPCKWNSGDCSALFGFVE